MGAMPELHELVFLMDRRTGFGLVSLPMPASPLDRRSASLISLFGMGEGRKKEGRKEAGMDLQGHSSPLRSSVVSTRMNELPQEKDQNVVHGHLLSPRNVPRM